jgi:hypothetical protein
MQELINKINKLEKIVSNASKNPNFIHHKCFLNYHLKIVEKIASELCEIHKETDKDIVSTLVWIHDYGKILNFDNRYQETINSGRKILSELGFPEDFSGKVIKYAEMVDKKMEMDLHNAPIEVKIISSADAASHLVGPFYALWWYEHPDKDPERLTQDNAAKAIKDWQRKIVLPEVKEAFKGRYNFLLEQCGIFPENYIIKKCKIKKEKKHCGS